MFGQVNSLNTYRKVFVKTDFSIILFNNAYNLVPIIVKRTDFKTNFYCLENLIEMILYLSGLSFEVQFDMLIICYANKAK